ncbi:tRNA uridine-5-carboxymethylaminomethyl(34) synthesis GTPase MnmE [Bacillota bacterium LX-D]|nr:tRNA uridine-5-carboxymethylaminomethyl(34) synthesis GTPase MnmE [Bacillota bacterium LX-D]
MDETIAAIATPPGEGGIGIVRISGADAIALIDKIFVPKYQNDWQKKLSHHLYLGYIQDGEKIIDEVLVAVMKGPKSFTKEDVVEINCHGGYLPLRLTLELVLQSGARLAEPGEFSKRAFLNGRLDLAQAEAIIDVIHANSRKGLETAINQLEGKLSQKITALRQEILGILAFLEAAIDFPEDEIEALSHKQIEAKLSSIKSTIRTLIKSYNTGKVYRDGIRTVIVGRPNVGKSSLLNALLKENRAIVTDIPGTTRDIIEEFINLGGVSLKIVDTAGIRSTEDIVEKIGVEKSLAAMEEADLVLVMADAVQGLTKEDQEILELVQRAEKKYLLLINKIDLVEEAVLELEKYKDNVLFISAKEELGLEELGQAVQALFQEGQIAISNDLLVTKLRHYEALVRTEKHIAETEQALKKNLPEEFLAIDLRAAWEILGEITGGTVTEDLVERIFADFCIGK